MNLTKIFAGLLFVVAVGLAVGAWMLSRQPNRSGAPAVPELALKKSIEQHAVVVAAKAIAAGQRLVAEDVKVAQMPVVVANSFASTDLVIGRTTVIALPAEAPLFDQHLLSGLALQLESGQRAVSVAIKEAMAAGHHVRPGDFVDVFFTLDEKSDQVTVDTQARLLLARSRVLAYGPASVENPPPTAAQRKAQQDQEASSSSTTSAGGRRAGGTRDQQGGPSSANTAVLAVPLEDVERLTLAEKYGQLTLALRHPDDMAVPDASMFAELPTALQPVAGRLKKGEQLQGADRSFAGLRFKDLALGAEARKARSPAPAPALQQAGVKRSPAPGPASQQNTVEMYQGSAVQIVSY